MQNLNCFYYQIGFADSYAKCILELYFIRDRYACEYASATRLIKSRFRKRLDLFLLYFIFSTRNDAHSFDMITELL